MVNESMFTHSGQIGAIDSNHKRRGKVQHYGVGSTGTDKCSLLVSFQPIAEGNIWRGVSSRYQYSVKLNRLLASIGNPDYCAGITCVWYRRANRNTAYSEVWLKADRKLQFHGVCHLFCEARIPPGNENENRRQRRHCNRSKRLDKARRICVVVQPPNMNRPNSYVISRSLLWPRYAERLISGDVK